MNKEGYKSITPRQNNQQKTQPKVTPYHYQVSTLSFANASAILFALLLTCLKEIWKALPKT